MNEITTAVAEQSSRGRTLTERILISAPTADDAALITEILGSREFEVVVIRDVASLAVDWEAGAGVLLLASEVLNDAEYCTSLRQLFDAQDSWSDIPVVILGSWRG